MTEPTEGATDAATESAPPSQEPTTFGERLRQLRTTLGLSVTDYAQCLDVCPKTLYRWYQLTAPRRSALQAVQAVFPEVHAAWLTRGQGPVFSAAPPLDAAESADIVSFGTRLHVLCQRLGLSAEGLARRLSISRQTLGRWQRLDAPLPNAVRAVRGAFPEVNTAWLTRGQGPVFSSARAEAAAAPVPEGQGGLEERGRSVCLSLNGPSGRVLARVDMVLMGSSQPLQVPLSMSESS